MTEIKNGFNEKDRELIIDQFLRWFDIYKENYPKHEITSADIYHSSLLRLLLDGREPYKYPPPRAFSYPWYSVLDGKKHKVFECSIIPNKDGQSEVLLEQSIYSIAKVIKDDNEYIIADKNRLYLFKITRINDDKYSNWEIQLIENLTEEINGKK